MVEERDSVVMSTFGTFEDELFGSFDSEAFSSKRALMGGLIFTNSSLFSFKDLSDSVESRKLRFKRRCSIDCGGLGIGGGGI